jgi:hypothetical protein
MKILFLKYSHKKCGHGTLPPQEMMRCGNISHVPYLTCLVIWTNRFTTTRHSKTHKSSISVLLTAKNWLSCVGSRILVALGSSVQFQKAGATAHTARVSMNVLQEMFAQHAISCGGDVQWPVCSPYLSACD